MDGGAQGKTLLELIAVLAILSVLTTVAAPKLNASRESAEAQQFGQLLTRMLTLARRTAVTSGKRTTLCLSADQQHCSKSWSGSTTSILVFTDINQNRQLDSSDILHRAQSLQLTLGHGLWRGSLGRKYMRYRVDGSAVEFGRYSYCPSSRNRANFRQIVINHAGRAYTHYDDNGLVTDCAW
ncbi:prepilin-type N-terminal cleavage/methylation domain-containing protein [Halieaceae bacterium IMCC14734]|uniref:Type II secretion system protein H n=1 Tax=Candidatus Litorirhabdus singularis TaxID=2518993 RepID=A0ABT3TLI7_9GAMM|nr:GspH/FimT family pseudopilin [Candidatus Litorirhabdus singularis]MCX2983202.1 prepilin-type N-terminal cleavage/methylation domain-containing protein [Candidatus Litorirhabdus singularis]